MTKIIPALGIMFCCFVLHELISQLFLAGKEPEDTIFHTIMSWIAVIALFCSAPVGLVLLWHDMRMEKIHYERFRKERKPYEDLLERQYNEATEEAVRLKSELIDARFDCYVEGKEDGWNDGYTQGFANGIRHALASVDCPADQRTDLYLNAHHYAESALIDYHRQMNDPM